MIPCNVWGSGGDPASAAAGEMNLEAHMCLSTVYMDSGNEQNEIMREVARIEAERGGFWLINFFGEKTFIEGTIRTVNLADGYFVMLENKEPE